MMWAFRQFCVHFACLIHQKSQISWHYSFIQTAAIELEMARVQFLGSCAVKVKVGKSTACALFRGRVASESTVRVWEREPVVLPVEGEVVFHHQLIDCPHTPPPPLHLPQNAKKKIFRSSPKDVWGEISDQGLSPQTLISIGSLADCLSLIVSFSPSY